LNFKNFSIFERLELRSIAQWWDNLMYFSFTFSFMILFSGLITKNFFLMQLSFIVFATLGILCQIGEAIDLNRIIKIQNEQRKALRNMAKQRMPNRN